MLLLSAADVERVLDLDALVDAVGAALADLSAGKASMPQRIAAEVPERDGSLIAMPAYVPGIRALTTKLVSLFPRNRELPTHQALIACFDPESGAPVAVMDGTHLTAARTAAGSALATRLLAREDSGVLAILGTGVQARAHARAVVRARPFAELRIAGRDKAHARRLAHELSLEVPCTVVAADGFAEALHGADVACATTHATEPVVRRTWLAAGAHVNSVGYNTAGREVDGETVAAATVVVESRAAALAPPPAGSNDLLWPIRDGLVAADHVAAELGELVASGRRLRTSAEQITLYKSVGVAVEDAAAAALVLAAARERGIGQELRI
jgi:alanine dehydrogenase